MSLESHGAANGSPLETRREREARMSSKKMVVVAAILVVIGVGVAAMTGLLPPKNGSEGTIGAASRYQSQQLSDADVALADTKVQAFLQSDVFHKMATNAKFRKFVLGNSAELLGKFYAKSKAKDGADLSELLSGAEVAELMNASELLNSVAGEEAFKKAVQEQAMVEMAKASKLANSEGFSAEMLKKTKVALQEAGVSEMEKKSKLFENGAFVELLAEGQAVELLESPEALELLSNDSLAEIFNDADLQNVLMDSSVMEALEHAPVEALRKGVVSNP